MRTIKLVLGFGLVAVLVTVAGVGVAVLEAGPRLVFTRTPLVPFERSSVSPAVPSESPSPAALPAVVSLPVPFTSQAPLGDWTSSQHDCEEATLVMVDRYLRGDHSGALIDPQTAQNAINQMTPWKPSQDLTDAQLGEMAKQHLGWDFRIYPATPGNIKEQLALGRPVIAGVLTHGLGNPDYPGYRDHYEQPGWSVSHYLVVAGYDGDKVILNDPGITRGHGYSITFNQLFFAITDLDRAYPNLDQGLIVLVLAPDAAS
jgi:peptidase C39-like protein